MGKRPASSKATRGASKGKKPISSSSSNPKTRKFRSQYNSLAVIAKGGPSKKSQNKEATKNLAKDAVERKKLLDGIDNINMLGTVDESPTSKKKRKQDTASEISGGSKRTTASFASVWSNCTNASLNEFFQVWNPNLETHKEALAIIAGLSQVMSSNGSDQSDLEFAKTLFKIISSPDISIQVLTGSLLVLTFVIRKLPHEIANENFEPFYAILKDLMEKYHEQNRKTLVKCLIRCFASLSKAHPSGKECIESSLRKKINIAIRRYKVQNTIKL